MLLFLLGITIVDVLDFSLFGARFVGVPTLPLDTSKPQARSEVVS